MPINVCLAIVADTPTRLVVGVYPPATGVRSLLGGTRKPDLQCQMLEGWDFDCDAGVIRFAPSPTSAWPDHEVPLASLTRLTWCGVQDANFSGEYYHYALSLRFEHEGHGRLISLPGSDEYLCASRAQVQEIASRLHAFLKPVCPGLETTGLEDMIQVLRNPAEGFRSIQGKMATLLADLNDMAPPPHPADPAAPAALPAADPQAPMRELITRAHEALGRLSDVAAARQSNPTITAAGLAIQIAILFTVAALVGLWIFVR